METKIYVACLAAYNAGKLHGQWIEATTDVDAMQGQISAMLADSPEPDAEEWAIHDHEGLGDLGEYAGLAEVARRVGVVELADERDIPASVLLAYAAEYMSGEWDSDDLESSLDDRYDGSADTWLDFTQSQTEETCDMDSLPEWVRNYVDWDSMARDWRLGGDWSAYEGDSGTLYFFRTH